MPTPLGDFHQPDRLLDRHNFDKKYEEVIKLVDDGLPAADACTMVFELASNKTYHNWFNWAIEDIDAGFDETESNLIKLFIGLAKADARLHARLSKTAIHMAVDNENAQMLQFLLKTRYGYSEKNKSSVEISSNDAPIAFNIVDMKPNEDD